MIKGIVFDYGGVISIKGSFHQFTETFGPKYGKDAEELHDVIRESWDKARIGKISSEEFWKNVADYLNIAKEKLRSDCINFFGINEEVVALIKQLKSDYKIGILSNQIKDWLEEILETTNLNKYVDVMIGSYDAKKAKPDLELFKELLEKMKLHPEEIIFIDDQEKNIPPAKELGINMILFKNNEQLKSELKKLDIKV